MGQLGVGGFGGQLAGRNAAGKLRLIVAEVLVAAQKLSGDFGPSQPIETMRVARILI